MSTKIVIHCSNRLFTEGLKALLESERNIQVLDTFFGENSAKTMNDILHMRPDIILADFNANLDFLLHIPEEYLTTSVARILIIGDSTLRFLADRDLKDLVLKGVVGILPTSADAHLLKKALLAITAGELWLDRNTLMKLVASMKKSSSKAHLGKREKEIMFHICQGFHNKEIAQKLNISEQTVKSHCNRIYKKLGVSDRLQLVLHYSNFFI